MLVTSAPLKQSRFGAFGLSDPAKRLFWRRFVALSKRNDENDETGALAPHADRDGAGIPRRAVFQRRADAADGRAARCDGRISFLWRAGRTSERQAICSGCCVSGTTFRQGFLPPIRLGWSLALPTWGSAAVFYSRLPKPPEK